MKLFKNKPSRNILFIFNSRPSDFIHYYSFLTKDLFIIITFLVLITLFNGCLVVPVPNRSQDPFPDGKISPIIPGKTTKDTVKEKLGLPSSNLLDGRIFIYATEQKDWLLYGMILLPIIGPRFTETTPTFVTNLLIIEFDKNDIVTTVEKFCGDSGELKSGMYIVNSGDEYRREKRDWRFSDEELILRASDIIDKKAKQIEVPANKSVIYYYKYFSDSSEAQLDYNQSVNPGIDGFLIWVVDPGEHTISVTYALNSEILKIRCYPGEKYYVERSKGIMRENQKSVGEKEIAKRRLIIDRLATFDLDKN